MANRPGSSGNGETDHAEFDEDETLVDDPAPVNDFSGLDEDEESAPSDRRRDPLRGRL